MKYDRNQEILELADEGYTFIQIANKYGITRQCVSNIVKRQKIRNDFIEKNHLNIHGKLENRLKEEIIKEVMEKVEEKYGK